MTCLVVSTTYQRKVNSNTEFLSFRNPIMLPYISLPIPLSLMDSILSLTYTTPWQPLWQRYILLTIYRCRLVIRYCFLRQRPLCVIILIKRIFKVSLRQDSINAKLILACRCQWQNIWEFVAVKTSHYMSNIISPCRSLCHQELDRLL